MAQHVGASGSLYITPRFMEFDEASNMSFENQPDLYAVRFSLENDPSRKITCENGIPSEGQPTRYDWADTRQLAIQDTIQDKLLNCTLVKVTPIGQDDIPMAKGQVPEAKLAEIYAAVDVKQKTFAIKMSNEAGQEVGTFKLKIMLSTEQLKEEEKKEDDDMVPAGDLAAAQQ